MSGLSAFVVIIAILLWCDDDSDLLFTRPIRRNHWTVNFL